MADRSIRVISVEVADARSWRTEVVRLGRGYRNGTRRDLSYQAKVERYRAAQATAERLGVPVGIIVDVREEARDAR